MKLYEVIKLNEARSPHIQSGVHPFGSNQWALFLDDLDAPYYVFDNESTAMQAMDDFTNPNSSEAAVRRQYRANQRTLDAGYRNYLRPRENVTLDDLRAQQSRSGRRGFLRTFLGGNREYLFRLLAAAGIGASAFFGVASAIADVEEDPSLSPEEKAELTDILRGQLLLQLIATLLIIFRNSTLLRRAWPIVVIILGLWGALRESTNNNKQQLNEAAPLLPLAWGAIQTAGGFLLRAAGMGAARAAAGATAARTAGTAAARTAASAAGRTAGTAAARAGTAVSSRLTGANAIQFLRTAGREVAVSIILANPTLQRMLAEGIAGWGLAGDIIESLGNGVEGLVVVADEMLDGAYGTDFVRRNLVGQYEPRTMEGIEGEYFSETEWAKNVFGPLMFPGERESVLVPYITPERRESLMFETMGMTQAQTDTTANEPGMDTGTPLQVPDNPDDLLPPTPNEQPVPTG